MRAAAVVALLSVMAPANAAFAAAPAAADAGQSQSQQSSGDGSASGSGQEGSGQEGSGSDSDGSSDGSEEKPVPAGAKVSVEFRGKTYELAEGEDGIWSGGAAFDSADVLQDLPKTLTAEWTAQEDGKPVSGTVTLKSSNAVSAVTPTDRLGVTATAFRAPFSSKQVKFDVTADYETGEEAKAGWEAGKETVSLTKGADGAWSGVLPVDGLHSNNSPYHDSVSVGGETLKAVWSEPKVTVNDKGTVVWTRSMTAEGDVEGGHVRLTGDAIRLHDMHVALSVTRTGADGKQTTIEVPDSTVDDPSQLKDEYTLDAQDWSGVSDSYTLSGAAGPDASFDKPVYSLGDGADRVISQKVSWTDATGATQSRTIKVTIPFKQSAEQPESPAQLDGIYVNLTGKHEKGELIDGWNPRIHKYVVQIGEHDPSPYILPVGGDTVTVAAGDVLQTAYTATQTWNVKVKSGDETTSYQVVVVRAHSTPTADEAFTPGDAKPETPTVEAKDTHDATLVSWGWRDAGGAYHRVKDDSFQIPEGGVLAWEAKEGQTVTNSVEKTAPMRYTHRLAVLAPDGTTIAFQELHVVYVTADTHKAELTGLVVNGTPVAGFDAATKSYEVRVDDPAKWTVVPQYDKRLGMSVATHRDGDTATVTVTSADGLESQEYTVHAVRFDDSAAALASGALPQTGVGVTGLAAAAAVSLMASLAGAWSSRRRRD